MLQNINREIYKKTVKSFDRKSGMPLLVGAKEEAGRGLQALMDFNLQRTGWGSPEIGGEQGKKKRKIVEKMWNGLSGGYIRQICLHA